MGSMTPWWQGSERAPPETMPLVARAGGVEVGPTSPTIEGSAMRKVAGGHAVEKEVHIHRNL
jgi:hypothetical protein